MTKPKIPVKTWIKKEFPEDPPCLNTVKKWIKNDTIDGCIIGGLYYVYVTQKVKTGNSLADKVFNKLGGLHED